MSSATPTYLLEHALFLSEGGVDMAHVSLQNVLPHQLIAVRSSLYFGFKEIPRLGALQLLSLLMECWWSLEGYKQKHIG